MNRFLDDVLVGLVLLLSLSYALASLGPRSLRRRFLLILSRLAGRLPAFPGLGRAAQRLRAASNARAPGACGGCDDCGSETSAAPQSSNEINVPVEKIGRRV